MKLTASIIVVCMIAVFFVSFIHLKKRKEHFYGVVKDSVDTYVCDNTKFASIQAGNSGLWCFSPGTYTSESGDVPDFVRDAIIQSGPFDVTINYIGAAENLNFSTSYKPNQVNLFTGRIKSIVVTGETRGEPNRPPPKFAQEKCANYSLKPALCDDCYWKDLNNYTCECRTTTRVGRRSWKWERKNPIDPSKCKECALRNDDGQLVCRY